MKKWAFLTVTLYAVILLLLIVPMLLVAFAGNENIALKDAVKIFQQWFFWLCFAVMVAGQALLLLLPIDISERRFKPRRSLKLPVVVTTFFLGLLCFAGVLSILCAGFADRGIDMLDPFFDIRVVQNAFSQDKLSIEQIKSSGWGGLCGTLGLIAVSWGVWGMIFYRNAKVDEPEALVKRSTRWLLRGSILELLVAVPSHIIVRRRDDCCAPIGTFWGIATGISIMLLCFGPGVFFLFVERMRRLRPHR